MMFDELIKRYDSYMEAQAETPYPPEKVQGRGMHFAEEWNRLKSEICQHLQQKESEFSYVKTRLWMALLKRTLNA